MSTETVDPMGEFSADPQHRGEVPIVDDDRAKPKLNYGKTFTIGFGFLAISVVWAVYNAYIPIRLKDFGLASAAVGAVMAIDNVFAVTVQPLFGMISDQTQTRLGRRLPYAAVCAPIAAVCLIAMAYSGNLPMLIFFVVLCSLVMAAWRAPIVALMPDVTDSRLRSQANGVINFMGALGSLIALVIGGMVFNKYGMGAPFFIAAILLLAAVALLLTLVREPKLAKQPRPENVWGTLRETIAPRLNLGSARRRSLIFMMCVLFAYTMGSNAVETFFTLWATTNLGVQAGTASQLMACYAGAFILFTIPSGLIGSKFGRKRSIQFALIVAILLMLPARFVASPTIAAVGMFIFGALWTLVIVNAIPWITQLGGVRHTGAMTALYYLATAGGAVVSPILFGFIHDATGEYGYMFWFAACGFVLALTLSFFVHHGEADDAPRDELVSTS